jgi:hypothetical protein
VDDPPPLLVVSPVADDTSGFDVSPDAVSVFDVSVEVELESDFVFFVSGFFAIFAYTPLRYRLKPGYLAPCINI